MPCFSRKRVGNHFYMANEPQFMEAHSRQKCLLLVICILCTDCVHSVHCTLCILCILCTVSVVVSQQACCWKHKINQRPEWIFLKFFIPAFTTIQCRVLNTRCCMNMLSPSYYTRGVLEEDQISTQDLDCATFGKLTCLFSEKFLMNMLSFAQLDEAYEGNL